MIFCLAVLTLAGSPAAAEVSASVRLTQLGYLREGMEDASIAVRNFQIANGVHASGHARSGHAGGAGELAGAV